MQLLVGSCVGSLVFYALWLSGEPAPESALWLFATGAFVAAHYPLAQAQAYRALPERSTLVAAAAQPFSALELLLPWAVGWCADRVGVLAGLSLLTMQPLGLLLVVIVTRRATAKSA